MFVCRPLLLVVLVRGVAWVWPQSASQSAVALSVLRLSPARRTAQKNERDSEETTKEGEHTDTQTQSGRVDECHYALEIAAMEANPLLMLQSANLKFEIGSQELETS